MTRLRKLYKKAEIAENIETPIGNLMVTKNPNTEEMIEIKEHSLNDGFNALVNGELYIWNNQIRIDDINEYLINKINMSGLRVVSDYNECYLDGQNQLNFKQIMDMLKQYPLIFGNVDNEIEVKKYLDHASQLGIYDVGFVSLMKVNNYCKEHHIDFNSLKFEEDKSIFISKDWNNKNVCRCRNYLYASEATGEIVKLYSRYYADTNCRESQLVYDGQYLRDGFGGNIII